MSKKHDENKDLRILSRTIQVNHHNKTLSAPKNSLIGLRSLGRIDYLTHYCGWTFVYNNDVKISRNSSDNNDAAKRRKREAKKLAKENTLTNKKKK